MEDSLSSPFGTSRLLDSLHRFRATTFVECEGMESGVLRRLKSADAAIRLAPFFAPAPGGEGPTVSLQW